MSSPTTKICIVCGEDCSQRPRTKDPKGRYFCKPCYEAAQKRSSSSHIEPADELPIELELAAPVAAPIAPAVMTTHAPPEAPADEPEPGPLAVLAPRIGAGVLVALIVMAFVFGNLVTGLFVLFVAMAIANGYVFGALRITAALGGLFVSAIIGVPLGKAMEGIFGDIMHAAGLRTRMVSIAIVALIVVVVVAAGLHFAIKRLMDKKPVLKLYDRPAGAVMGLLQGSLLGVVLIWAVLSLEPIAVTSLAQAEHGNTVSEGVVSVSEDVRESVIGRMAAAINPLDEMRLISLFQKSLIMLNDPDAREAFETHPAIEGIKQRPSVLRALEMLAADTELTAILESSDGLDAQALGAILDNPTILRVLDETDLVSDLTPIAEDIAAAIEEVTAGKAD